MELTGDVGSASSDVKGISFARIICTTPEKWDSITRRWTEHIYLLGKVQLLLVDEVHNISDNRGGTLESVICRMKTVSKSAPVIKHSLPAANLRIIALSATLPNLGCIGEFVGATAENVLPFDASFRPVPLTVHVVSHPKQSSDYWFEKTLEKKVPDVLARYAGGRPALVFCGSRKSAEATAELVAKSCTSSNRDPDVASVAQRVGSAKLREAILRGVAFHHANLLPLERSLVERLFRDRKLCALCCTSTLAMGVNLPAHLVVIKSTAHWQGKAEGYAQTNSSTILQMMGRAGRPGLDDQGVAVIMTDESHRTQYEQLSHGCEVVESRLHEDLVEVLNSEVCNKVIESIQDAAEWVEETFLFTRLQKNPARYGLNIPVNTDPAAAVTAFLNEKLRGALEELTAAGILELDENGFSIVARRPGHIMSRNLLRLKTMKIILGADPDANIDDLLKALCSTAEVLVEVRHGQKKILKEIKLSVRFPLPKTKKLDHLDKTNLLLQGFLGRQPNEDQTLAREQHGLADDALRVLNAMVDHLVDTRAGRGVLSATLLRRNIERQLWESESNELYQLDGIPHIVIPKLAAAGFRTLESLAGASPMAIDTHAGRRAPFGAHLIASARRIVGQALTFVINANDGSATAPVTIEITRKNLLASYGGGPLSALSEAVSYTLIAFTKQPKQLMGGSSSSTSVSHGLHLFRKILEPGTVILPVAAMAAVRSSSLIVCLIGNFVGLDEHRSLTLAGSLDTSNAAATKPPSKSPGNDKGSLSITKENHADVGGESSSTSSSTSSSSVNEGGANKKAKVAGSPDKTSTQLLFASPDPSSYKSMIPKSAKAAPEKKRPQQAAKPDTYHQQPTVNPYDRFAFKGGSSMAASTPSIEISKKSMVPSIGFGRGEPEKSLLPDAALAQGARPPSSGIPSASPSTHVPRAGTFSRKGTTGSRDIRDCLSGPLGTLRRKADEMNLLSTVKSSRLTDQQGSAIKVPQPAQPPVDRPSFVQTTGAALFEGTARPPAAESQPRLHSSSSASLDGSRSSHNALGLSFEPPPHASSALFLQRHDHFGERYPQALQSSSMEHQQRDGSLQQPLSSVHDPQQWKDRGPPGRAGAPPPQMQHLSTSQQQFVNPSARQQAYPSHAAPRAQLMAHRANHQQLGGQSPYNSTAEPPRPHPNPAGQYNLTRPPPHPPRTQASSFRDVPSQQAGHHELNSGQSRGQQEYHQPDPGRGFVGAPAGFHEIHRGNGGPAPPDDHTNWHAGPALPAPPIEHQRRAPLQHRPPGPLPQARIDFDVFY